MRIVLPLALFVAVLGTAGCSNSGPQITSAHNATDADLQQMVQSKLATDPQLAKIDVSADASQNQVTLSGSVPDEQTRTEALEMARATQPDLTVEDKIDVKPPELSRSEFTGDMARDTREKAKALGDKIGQSVDDAWIYTKVEAQLASNSVTPARKINVDVSKNVVTLRGEVESDTVKQEAERIAKETSGVTTVRNLLKVRA
jgi:osmotically-inducible protein OsmY